MRLIPRTLKKWSFLANILLLYILKLNGYKNWPGNYCEEVIPDPIPNSEVKLFSADGTLP